MQQKRKKYRLITWVALIVLCLNSLTWFFYGRHHPPEFCCRSVEYLNIDLGNSVDTVFVIFSDRDFASTLAARHQNIFQVKDADPDNELFTFKNRESTIETYHDLSGIQMKKAVHTKERIVGDFPMYNITDAELWGTGLFGSSGYVHSVWLGWFWFQFYENTYSFS